VFLLFTSIIFFFPVSFDGNMQQTADGFNYTCVVVFAILLFAGVYWFLPKRLGGARHHFKGPKRPEDIEKENEVGPT
jgi:hypothetical protein